MKKNALILGCGNIAVAHAQALKKINHSIYAFDFDRNKMNIFSEFCKVNSYLDEGVNYNIIILCVPYQYREDYIEKFQDKMDRAESLVVEKPLRNISGETHEYINNNIGKIWTPYLRALSLPKIKKDSSIRINESRGFLHSSPSFKDTVFDLYPHWISIVVKYGIKPENFSIKSNGEECEIKIIHNANSGKNLESIISFKIGETDFNVEVGQKRLTIPKNKISLMEFVRHTKYYYDLATGGPFMQFYLGVKNHSNELREICDKTFELTKWIKVDEV